jgi:hypothetical protein
MGKLQYFVIADIHGEFRNLMVLMRKMRKAGFCLKKNPHQRLVQLGDRCDRGDDTFRVNSFFKRIQERFPNQVVVLNGNHEDMMVNAVDGDSWLFIRNGGNETIRSYNKGSGLLYYLPLFMAKVKSTGHYDWLKSLPYYYETDDYFFSHAPIPIPSLRAKHIRDLGLDFRYDKQTLTWSYEKMAESAWVDPDPTGEGKINVHGHIHGLYVTGKGKDAKLKSPGVRRYGGTYLADTGSGCCQGEPNVLSCLILPDSRVINSNGGDYKV